MLVWYPCNCHLSIATEPFSSVPGEQVAIWKSRLYDQQVPRRKKSYQYIYSLGETHFGISVAGNAHREKGLTRATNLLLDHLASRAFSPFFFFLVWIQRWERADHWKPLVPREVTLPQERETHLIGPSHHLSWFKTVSLQSQISGQTKERFLK